LQVLQLRLRGRALFGVIVDLASWCARFFVGGVEALWLRGRPDRHEQLTKATLVDPWMTSSFAHFGPRRFSAATQAAGKKSEPGIMPITRRREGAAKNSARPRGGRGNSDGEEMNATLNVTPTLNAQVQARHPRVPSLGVSPCLSTWHRRDADATQSISPALHKPHCPDGRRLALS